VLEDDYLVGDYIFIVQRAHVFLIIIIIKMVTIIYKQNILAKY